MAIHLDDAIRELIDNAGLNGMACFVATASKDGEPDLGPKGSVMVFDDQSLAFWERVLRTTWRKPGGEPTDRSPLPQS